MNFFSKKHIFVIDDEWDVPAISHARFRVTRDGSKFRGGGDEFRPCAVVGEKRCIFSFPPTTATPKSLYISICFPTENFQ